MYVRRKSMKDATSAARGGLMTPSTLKPRSLGGTDPLTIVAIPPAGVVSTPRASTPQVALETLGALVPHVALLELSSPTVVPEEASVVEVVRHGGTSSAEVAVPTRSLPPPCLRLPRG